jgi:peptidoglycan/LPS O-acetylase OafA/YrhL
MTEAINLPHGSRGWRAPVYSLNEKIDLCRGIFAFLVVSAHAIELSRALDPATFSALRPWVQDFLTYIAGTGLYYVMGFFVISGYCIQRSVERLSNGISFPLRTYITSRLTRILPLYYLSLLATVVIEQTVAAHRPLVWANGLSRSVLISQVLLIQNFTQTYGSFAPSWSITNELVYYVLFGLLASVLTGTRLKPAALGLVICIAIGMVTQLAYRSGYRSPIVLSIGLLFGLGFNWFLGALVAVNADQLVRLRTVDHAARLWPLLLAVTMGLWLSQRVHLECVYLCAGISFTLMLIRFLAADARQGSTTRQEPDFLSTLFGLASYPTYLLHGPILLMMGSVAKNNGVASPWWLVWLVGTFTAIGIGLILGYVAERPIMAWRAGYLQRLKKTLSEPARGRATLPVLGIEQ